MTTPKTDQIFVLQYTSSNMLIMKDIGAKTIKAIPPRYPIEEPQPGLICIKVTNIIIGISERMNPFLPYSLFLFSIFQPCQCSLLYLL